MGRSERVIWVLVLIWAALVPWFASRPPLNDLPQHAAQVALFSELVHGDKRWGDVVSINLLTPYLLGYGLTFLFSQVMSVAAALKLVLALSFIGFIAMTVVLRRQFQGEPRLDWLPVCAFFGLPYQWGLLTFLISAPLGMAFFWFINRFIALPTWRRALAASITGVALLFSHGLVFIFSWLLSGVVTLISWRSRRDWLRSCVPLGITALAALAFFAVSKKTEAELGVPLQAVVDYGWRPLVRAAQFFITPVDERSLRYVPVTAALLVAPLVLRLRPQIHRPQALVPLLAVLAVFVAAPKVALNTDLIYPRFGLFVLPAAVWAFARSSSLVPRWRVILASMLMIGATIVMLGIRTMETVKFDRESREFDALLERAEPGARALYLPFDTFSDATHHLYNYVHFALWYQAEKEGFVDMNFARFAPQIVRFRPGHLAAVDDTFSWNPGRFDWKREQGDLYRYFFVRAVQHKDPSVIFKTAPCLPRLVVEQGWWQLYEASTCK